MELCPKSAGIGDALWPLNRHRVSRAAEVARDLLHPLKWRVESPRPSRVVMVFATSGPEVVDVLEKPFGIFGDSILKAGGTPRTVNCPFATGAVITGDVHHDGVVIDSESLGCVEESTNVRVGVR